jgi:hypothetical protein
VYSVLSDGYDPANPDRTAKTSDITSCPTPTLPPTDLWRNHVIHFNAYFQGLRWGFALENQTTTNPVIAAYPGAGMTYDVPTGRFDVFELVTSHEARHSLQLRLSADLPSNDADLDGFVVALSADGQTLFAGDRLLDSAWTLAGGTNPEFNLHGDVAATANYDCASINTSSERDAIMVQRLSTHRTFQLAGMPVLQSTSIPVNNRATVRFSVVSKMPAVNFLFWGNVATAQVTAGACKVSDLVGAPASSAVFNIIPNVTPQSQFYTFVVTTPAAPGTCDINLTPYLPTDDTAVPLTPGTSQTLHITVTP